MVNSVGKKYSAVNCAYLAGLFDGDGAIMACIEHHKEKKFRFRVRIYIKISQKNKRILEKLQQELNCGRNSKKDLIKIAQLADSLSSYNIRSQKRRKNYASKIQEYFSSND